MIFAIKFYTSVSIDEKPIGIPDIWPAEVIEFSNDEIDPDLDLNIWHIMTPDEYNNYLDTNRTDYINYTSKIDIKKLIDQKLQSRMESAIAFGKQLMIDYAKRNILAGKTTQQIMDIMIKMQFIKNLLDSGSLYTALDAIRLVPIDDITPQEDMDWAINKLKNYLQIQ